MEKQNSRRGFLRLLGLIGLGSTAVAAVDQKPSGAAGSHALLFHGTSHKGDLNEAIHQAVSLAEGSVHHPDAMVTWKLSTVSGRMGGIAGFNEITATIEAKAD